MSQTTNPSDPLTLTNPSGGRSHFAAGARLTGDLSVPGLMELVGHIDGTIAADAIVIEESGSAVGELKAKSITVKGQFKGKILGGDVKLQSSARVSGEIAYATLTIESGAEVNSACSPKVRRET